VDAVRAPWLDQLEATLADTELAVGIVTAAAIAGRDVALDEEELRGAARRAVFVLAAGGDPERGLDLQGPAVTSFAADIDTTERRDALEAGLARLAADATGLPHVSEAVRGLLDAPETAWRAFACSVLAEHVASD
jgi:hypothetical protein